jgi:hypothetical protein
LKIFGNVLEHPQEPKYRQVLAIALKLHLLIQWIVHANQSIFNAMFLQVKTSSNLFKTTIQAAKGGEHLLQLAGWRTNVVNMEKFYVFDAEPGSHKWQIMEEGAAMLNKGLGMIHEKAEVSEWLQRQVCHYEQLSLSGLHPC